MFGMSLSCKIKHDLILLKSYILGIVTNTQDEESESQASNANWFLGFRTTNIL